MDFLRSRLNRKEVWVMDEQTLQVSWVPFAECGAVLGATMLRDRISKQDVGVLRLAIRNPSNPTLTEPTAAPEGIADAVTTRDACRAADIIRRAAASETLISCLSSLVYQSAASSIPHPQSALLVWCVCSLIVAQEYVPSAACVDRLAHIAYDIAGFGYCLPEKLLHELGHVGPHILCETPAGDAFLILAFLPALRTPVAHLKLLCRYPWYLLRQGGMCDDTTLGVSGPAGPANDSGRKLYLTSVARV